MSKTCNYDFSFIINKNAIKIKKNHRKILTSTQLALIYVESPTPGSGSSTTQLSLSKFMTSYSVMLKRYNGDNSANVLTVLSYLFPMKLWIIQYKFACHFKFFNKIMYRVYGMLWRFIKFRYYSMFGKFKIYLTFVVYLILLQNLPSHQNFKY